MELKGWKAGVVLTASMIIILNLVITIPAFVAIALLH